MTHINAYYADVEEKKAAVATAQAELDEAIRRLQAKEQEEHESEATPVVTEEPAKEEKSDKDKKIFNRR